MWGRDFSIFDNNGFDHDSLNRHEVDWKIQKKIDKLKMYSANPPYPSDYVLGLESEIRNKREEVSNLAKELNKRIDIPLIKTEQTKLLTQYKNDWNNSWRSWCLFVDDTRKDHVKNLMRHIDGLMTGSLVEYLRTLEKEEKYAKAHHAKHYIPTINKMRVDLLEHFDQESKILLQKMLDAEVEIRRLITKEHGHEKYNHKLANLGRYIK